jgi:hypothetical protein
MFIPILDYQPENKKSLSTERIKDSLKDKTIEELRSIKEEIELQIRNKNPQNINKINKLIFDKICNDNLFNGRESRYKILINLFKYFGYIKDNKETFSFNYFIKDLKIYLKNINVTDINNIPENKYFEVVVKSPILDKIYKIVSYFETGEDSSIRLSVVKGHLTGNYEEYIKKEFIKDKVISQDYLLKKHKEYYKKYSEKFPDFFNKKYEIEDLINENIEIIIIDKKNNKYNKFFINNSFVFKDIKINELTIKIKSINELKEEEKRKNNEIDNTIEFGF